jgi:hypothetical protein
MGDKNKKVCGIHNFFYFFSFMLNFQNCINFENGGIIIDNNAETVRRITVSKGCYVTKKFFYFSF